MINKKTIPIKDALMILNTELDVRNQDYYDYLQCGGERDCIEEANSNALAMAIEALEKRVPKKPKLFIYGHVANLNEQIKINGLFCPNCEAILSRETMYLGICKCGQVIRRSNEE